MAPQTVEANEDGSYTAVYEITLTFPELTEVTDLTPVLYWRGYTTSAEYKEVSIAETSTWEVVDGKVIITMNVSKDLVEAYAGPMGYDVYFDLVLGGFPTTDNFVTSESEFPLA